MPDPEAREHDGLFDYVIVGGGSAGCVLASRLSAVAQNRVLLVEAGVDTPPGSVPAEIRDAYPMALFFGDRYIWPGLRVTANRDAEGRPNVRSYEQGRVMGGGSSINVQSANRGLPRDYDEWAELGATGWAWNDVLPYFIKLENDLDCNGPLHGKAGPLPIRRTTRNAWPPFAHAVATAFATSNLPFRLDQNGEFEDGLFPPAFSNLGGQRASTATCYLTEEVRRAHKSGDLAGNAGNEAARLRTARRRHRDAAAGRDGDYRPCEADRPHGGRIANPSDSDAGGNRTRRASSRSWHPGRDRPPGRRPEPARSPDAHLLPISSARAAAS